jgi:hypothetical protein
MAADPEDAIALCARGNLQVYGPAERRHAHSPPSAATENGIGISQCKSIPSR